MPGTTKGFFSRLFAGIFFILVYIDKRYNNVINEFFSIALSSLISIISSEIFLHILTHYLHMSTISFICDNGFIYIYTLTHNTHAHAHVHSTLLIVIIIIKCTLFQFFFHFHVQTPRYSVRDLIRETQSRI